MSNPFEILQSASRRAMSVIAIMAVTITLSGSAQAEVCGQLAGVKGTGVEVLRLQSGREGEKIRHGLRVEANKVIPIECDDIVLAGRDSSAKIILANGKLSLGPESRIELAAHTGASSAGGNAKVSLINLTYGKMRALIQKAPAAEKGAAPAAGVDKGRPAAEPQASFRVRTFSAVAGVRGTDFFTAYDPNAGLTEQATIEGAVEVQQAGTNQKVLVEGGKQVAVETTPAAVAAAEERIKSGGETSLEPPKLIPASSEVAKPIVVEPIKDSLRNEIRVASAVVRDDKDFAHPKAIEALGQPKTWVLERENVPDKLKQIKNEF